MTLHVSVFFYSRVMDSKWGGKSETINMTLNVEQVLNKSQITNYDNVASVGT